MDALITNDTAAKASTVDRPEMERATYASLLPMGLHPETHPIICRHWYGLDIDRLDADEQEQAA